MGPHRQHQSEGGQTLVVEIPYTDALLQPVHREGRPIAARELWREVRVLILLIRRPGCGICRSLARHIWRQKQQFDAYGLKLVCLIHQLLPGELESFQSFWPGEAYIDINKLLYKELGRGRLPKLSRFQFCLTILRTLLLVKSCRAADPEAKTNLKGTLRNLGGLMIMKPGAQGVAYRRPEKWMGDFPSNAEILQACRAVCASPLGT